MAISAALKRRSFGETQRRDMWWLQPAAVVAALGGAIVYMTWAAFQGAHYSYEGYLSPLYSPEIFGASHHALFHVEGGVPAWWPAFLPYSPAFLILAFPAGFRLTCYYYRGAYYKAFVSNPASCTVGKPWKGYGGELRFPLFLQNLHRYFLYLALGFICILAWDAWKAMWFVDPATGQETFGIGVGTLVLTMNVVLLGGYTFGCHSLRHLVGGALDRIAARPARRCAYECVSWFNLRHMNWAWCSLVWVAFSDLYVRLCSMGVWSDLRIL